ncbi:hypothetical protein [Beijerinckia sp. L45]|uniref:hypothetical protein n=1 Tax=Beijerinckia sp. L45 TaxID=1641855 RepID=UPI00131D3A77|nr:hypothetical protein [Beijerinckia sp. L45]
MRYLAIIFLVGVSALAGCTTVPSFDGLSRVPVSAVVARLKCDLRYVARAKTKDPLHRYDFLAHWAAKVRLTIAVDDTVGLNPGATITEPLRNAYAVVAGPTSLGGSTIGSVAQSFGVGIGAGLSTEAVRQEDLEFFLSFAELTDDGKISKYEGNKCQEPFGQLLESDMKLDELFDSALQPVADRVLTTGDHPPLTQTVPG